MMGAYRMKIDFSKLFDKLKENGLTQIEFRKQVGIGNSTLARLVNNENCNTETICKICDFFHCMPEDIMSFIPDENYNKRQKEKEETQAEIERLREKLKKL